MSIKINIITLTVAGKELKFEPELVAYNKCLNESARTENIIGAVSDYLKRIVLPECRESLNELLLIPGAPGQIAAKVNELYAPALDIEVKPSAS
ncbi:putative phage tail assembly chaperone [Edaphovirga cremea]|uniref:putative phage tail assembly chaperone n=1 Tax=Edaphovirga cremea TaxID=2267246 RepID=UPI0039895E95